MRHLLPLLAVVLAALPARAEPPKRVVTVNLCLDQLALRLAAPGQLVGVSYLATDPRLSVMAEQARQLPTVRASAESILDLRPDLVIVGRDQLATVKHLLRRAGVPLLELPWASSLAEAEGLIRQIGAALGREDAARAVIEDMQARRAALPTPAQPAGTAAVLGAHSATAGRGSLMDELLRLAGWRNLAADLGIGAYGRLRLEAVLAGQPDLLVFDGAANDNPSRATEFIDHHALSALDGHARIVSVPLRHSICAGPDNLEVLRKLAEARNEARR
ncbi:MAG: ABC transporter substrate-binding protein [Proteobacteria bacterium]|nr:ABC transporter substrate-binding protein [Pseudomonadota bacterium]